MNLTRSAHLARLTCRTALLAAIGTTALTAHAQTTLALWNFTGVVAAPYNNPAVTSGTAMTSAAATQLGMTNTYGGSANTASCDVLANSASPANDPNPASTQFAWRVRGTGSNGWNTAAPQFSQGAEFDAPTTGYNNVKFTFDWFCTTSGIRDLQVQYNLNTANTAGWTNYTGTDPGVTTATGNAVTNSPGSTILVATSNGFNTSLSTPTNVIDLSGIAGASNDPSFGIRLVSTYDPSASTGMYTLASTGAAYVNGSGNWRFDQIAFQGTAITGAAAPEPGSVALLGTCALPLLGLSIRRYRATRTAVAAA